MEHARPEVTLPASPTHALTVKHRFGAGWEQWYFLQSDCHEDSTEHLRKLHTRHLAMAKERDALICDFGDFPDVISGRHDKRGSKDSVRADHAGGNYLDLVIDSVVDEHRDVADNWLVFGRGNHDQKILAHCETDILKRIVEGFNAARTPGLPNIHVAGYGYWIRFMFEADGGGHRQSVYLKGFHGSGGGGEVTKGTMEAQRMAATVSNADIVVTGHVHEKWEMELVREHLTDSGRVVLRPRTHTKLGSYKQDFRIDGAPTWHMMRPGGTPKPVGGKFLRFFADGSRVAWEITDAPVNYADLG